MPAGTPVDRIRRLNQKFGKARNARETVGHPTLSGSHPITGTPEEFGAFVKSELLRWKALVKEEKVLVEGPYPSSAGTPLTIEQSYFATSNVVSVTGLPSRPHRFSA